MRYFLLAYILLTFSLILSYGHYHPKALITGTLGTIAVIWGVLAEHDVNTKEEMSTNRTLFLGLTGIMLCSIMNDPLLYERASWWHSTYGFFVCGILLILATYCWSGKDMSGPLRTLRILILLSCGVLARVCVPSLSPHPHIDAWTVQQEAVDVFMDGLSPYAHGYEQIYDPQTLEMWGYTSGFYYPPLILFYILPFKLLFHDVRYAYIFAELISLWLFWKIINRNCKALGANTKELLLLLLALNPVSLLVIEQSWNEPLLNVLLLGFICLWQSGKVLWASILLGGFIAAKQYALLALPLVVLLPEFRRFIPVVFMTIGLFYSPGLLWGAKEMVGSFLYLWTIPPRADALSFSALFLRKTGMILPDWLFGLTVFSGFGITLLTFKRSIHGYIAALCIIFIITFWMGKQAFCNYYYFLSVVFLAAAMTKQK
jgi:hypothetical protein